MFGSVATVSRAAIAHNAALLADLAEPATLCAVVKADGYGHGAVEVALAALRGGARWLAVAHVGEAEALRGAGIDAPVLLLSEPATDADTLDAALSLDLHLVAYRTEFLDAVAARARATGRQAQIHLNVDTGMRRVGVEPHQAVAIARRIVDDPALVLAGTMTHPAVADEPGNPGTGVQLDRFDAVLADLAGAGIDPGIRHAANSAATMIHPRARYDMVRAGIALYGIPPSPVLASFADLQPALRWTSEVRFLKPVSRGEGISYGHHHVFEEDTMVATVPAGYADGVRRRLGIIGGEVLIRGRRRPMVGVVTMDHFMVDVGPDTDVEVGDEVVLLGAQGDDEITATELGLLLDTIGYEITCAISPRVPRVYA